MRIKLCIKFVFWFISYLDKTFIPLRLINIIFKYLDIVYIRFYIHWLACHVAGTKVSYDNLGGLPTKGKIF